MNVFTFAFLVVCVVSVAGIIQTWLKQKHKQAQAGAAGEETIEKLELLEERIRVLERIVTENRVDLKQQISDL